MLGKSQPASATLQKKRLKKHSFGKLKLSFWRGLAFNLFLIILIFRSEMVFISVLFGMYWHMSLFSFYISNNKIKFRERKVVGIQKFFCNFVIRYSNANLKNGFSKSMGFHCYNFLPLAVKNRNE